MKSNKKITIDLPPYCINRQPYSVIKSFLKTIFSKDVYPKAYQSIKEKKDHLLINRQGIDEVCYHVIDDEKELDKWVKAFDDNLKKGIPWIFRGIADASYQLYSSSQRRMINKYKDKYCKLLKPESEYDLVAKAIERVWNSRDFMDFMKKYEIPVNDMLILSVLQHFINLSPLLDFSYDVYSGLFFATDNAPEAHGGLRDYVSLYYIDSRIDWVRCSVQEVEHNGAETLQNGVDEFYKENKYIPDSAGVREKMARLSYSQYVQDGIKFLTLEGAKIGITDVSIPILGFNTQYHITNPRLAAQNGLFIINFTEDTPLADLLKEVDGTKQILCCVDINKSLIPFIKDKYLRPRNISRETMYYPNDDAKELEDIINNIFK